MVISWQLALNGPFIHTKQCIIKCCDAHFIVYCWLLKLMWVKWWVFGFSRMLWFMHTTVYTINSQHDDRNILSILKVSMVRNPTCGPYNLLLVCRVSRGISVQFCITQTKHIAWLCLTVLESLDFWCKETNTICVQSFRKFEMWQPLTLRLHNT